jgi:hypothetical protein
MVGTIQIFQNDIISLNHRVGQIAGNIFRLST